MATKNKNSTEISDEFYEDFGPSNNDHEELINGSTSRVYWYRWYICFTFAFLGLLQGIVWNTWSPINQSSEAALGFTASDITLLANWGPISFLICMPIYSWLFERFGLRSATLSAAFFIMIGTALRCLPATPATRRILIHMGQFMNGIAGCPVMAAPSLLSNVWFPPHERITATSITGLFNYFGTGAAYAIGFLVDDPSNITTNTTKVIETQINNIMYVEMSAAVAIFVAVLVYFPNKPKLPPSVSASIQRMSFFDGLKALLKNKSFWIVAVTAASLLGSWGGWTGVMTVILEKIDISESTADMMGFVLSAAGCVVAMVVGWLTDRLKGRMKTVFLAILLISFVAFLYFVIIYQNWIDIPFFQPHLPQMWTVMVILGIALNALVPLGMELVVDVAYPVSEGTTASILVWFNNLFSFVFLLLLNLSSDPSFSNYVMLAFFFLAYPLVMFGSSNENRRLQLDQSSHY